MQDGRKYYLDWLRVGAFLMLVLFHAGLLYASWDYNIKSPRLYPALEYVLVAISPWRLVLLFFIAGVASRFLLARLGAGVFALDRLRRLLVVLLLGIVVINPLQVYVEFLHKGYIDPGYLDFWLGDYLGGSPFPGRDLPTWDHLWFLLYLLLYSLVFALTARLGIRPGAARLPLAWLLILPAAWLCATTILVQTVSPVTQAFVDDWGNHLRWAGVFAAGVYYADRNELWAWLAHRRRRLLALSAAGLVLLEGFAVLSRANAIPPAIYPGGYGLVHGVYGWTVVLTLCGFAAQHLNRPSALLRYLNDAVLPIYVLHQPILLAVAFGLFPLALPIAIEAGLLVLITGAGSLACYALLIRPWPISRRLFGLKASGPAGSVPQNA